MKAYRKENFRDLNELELMEGAVEGDLLDRIKIEKELFRRARKFFGYTEDNVLRGFDIDYFEETLNLPYIAIENSADARREFRQWIEWRMDRF